MKKRTKYYCVIHHGEVGYNDIGAWVDQRDVKEVICRECEEKVM